jgi:hypothetical protein
MNASAAPIALCLACPLLWGCVAVDNDRHVIGRSVPVEAVTAWSREPGATPADGPSVAGADRSTWQRTEYLVPVDGTYHWPTYTFPPPTPEETDRQRGIAPTPLTALEMDKTNGAQAAETLEAPIVAAVEILAIIPRMFIEPPWVAVRSPGDWPYQRSRSEYDPPDVDPQAGP